MSEIERIGRLALECARNEDDPEPWNQLLRFLERRNYDGTLKAAIEEAIEHVNGNHALKMVRDAFWRLHKYGIRKKIVACHRADNDMVHFKHVDEKRPLCRRHSSATLHLTYIPVTRTRKICGACMELLPKSLRDTDFHEKIMGNWTKSGLQFDYPWDWIPTP